MPWWSSVNGRRFAFIEDALAGDGVDIAHVPLAPCVLKVVILSMTSIKWDPVFI
ncbi:hypothetical protein WJ970_19835 [Achromobacter xylosoxidans]